jgi:HAD superfamily hydrolase (TIGR01509 family)
MEGLTSLQGILFDFDGLIVDTETALFQAWQELYRDFNRELTLKEWAGYIGKSIEETDPVKTFLDSLGGKVERKALREEIASREKRFVNQTEILPGVKELILRAKKQGLALGIVSSSDRDWVVTHLRRLSLEDYFEHISSSDEVERAKPDPALYHLGLSKAGLDPKQVIVLEDSPNGVLAAKRAGLFCIAVPNPLTRQLSYHPNGGQPDRIIQSLEDFSLEDYLQEAV